MRRGEIYSQKQIPIKFPWFQESNKIHEQFSNLQIFIQSLEQTLKMKQKSHGLYCINLSFSVNIPLPLSGLD